MVVYKVTVITKNDHQPTLSHRPDPFRPLFSIFGILALCFGLFLCFGLCLCFSFVFQAMRMFRVCVSGMGFGFCFGLVLCFELWFFCFLFLFLFTGFDGHGRVVVVQWFLWVWWWLWWCMIGCRNYRSTLDKFSPIWVWGWGRSLWDLDLISNTLMKSGSAHGRKVLAIKAHVNTWVVMCKQWY